MKRTKIRLEKKNKGVSARGGKPSATSNGDTVHDRRAQELMVNAQVVVADVIDPHGLEKGDKIRVFRSIRGNPLAAMHALGQLHPDDKINDILKEAADLWLKFYEGSQIGSLKANDHARVVVDGGKLAESNTEFRMRAAEMIERCRAALGNELSSLTIDVLHLGYSLKDAAAKRGLFTRRDIEGIAWAFKNQCLQTIAIELGLLTRPQIPTIYE